MLVANEIFVINKVHNIESSDKSIKKCEKLSKTRKLFKSQKSAKSKKKLSKSRNLPNFNAKENGPSFWTLNAKTTFNYLSLAFINVLIF